MMRLSLVCVVGMTVSGSLLGCGGGGSGAVDAPKTADGPPPIDAPKGDASRAIDAPSGTPATATFASVAVTSLAGASGNAGVAGTFSAGAFVPGTSGAPAVSNTVVSAIPGAPPKVVFVGQATAFDDVLVAVEGQTGFFEIPAGTNNTILGLDLVTSATAPKGTVTVSFATKTGTTISAATSMQLVLDAHVFVAAGDLLNHDTAGTDVADLFGAVLEGKQGNPVLPMQIVTNHDNNTDITTGIKGDVGPLTTGHREIVWDGVPEALRNKSSFSPTFFDRQAGGSAGVQGGVIFTPIGGSGEEVNDALNGVVPNAATVGPPNNPNAALGGDFSNVIPGLAGGMIAFTQDAVFAPLGTVTTDVTFHVAASSVTGAVTGVGVVFISVDNAQASTIEFFDSSGVSLNKTVVPPRSAGPFPVPGPISGEPNNIPYSFAGWIDSTKRCTRVRITNGQVAVDKATQNDHIGTPDVVVLDDVYYSEPQP